MALIHSRMSAVTFTLRKRIGWGGAVQPKVRRSGQEVEERRRWTRTKMLMPIAGKTPAKGPAAKDPAT